MKQLLLALVLTTSCGAAQPAQQPQKPTPAQAAAKPVETKRIDASRLLEDARALSADSMEGREAGTKG
ncbi:MAG TPA: hypothetical protein VD861_03005, partial [Pyrinomonadaceae bacterium]|nr:hypothetical protein [Pyrinomonadaceae bacterium]